MRKETDMDTVLVDLPLDKIKKALRQLPSQKKMALWRLLDEDIDRPAIERRFASSVNTIRKTYAHSSEEEVMSDAVKATKQVRRARHAKSRS
jgi:hypothetical protein